MELRVLGPLEVSTGGRPLVLGEPRTRQVLSVLALHRGRPVSVETIAEALWGDEPPASSAVTVQGHISRLRRTLEPRRAPREAGKVIQTSAQGYTLRLPDHAVDAAALEKTVRAAVSRLRTVPDQPWLLDSPDDSSALEALAGDLDAALASWRGDPYAELHETPQLESERTRLNELRIAAIEAREMIRMHTGDAAAAARGLGAIASAHPHRERTWMLWAAALAMSHRQADALDALRRLRDALREDLGIRAGAAVGVLETSILRQQLASGYRRSTAPGERPAPPRWPLAGRLSEVIALRELLERASTGDATAAYVTGEAGAGKTRLAQEAIAAADDSGFVVAVARCSAQSPPLWPLRTALASLSRQLPGLAVDLTRLDHSPDDFATRRHAIDAILAAGARAPVLLVIEDVQWADPASLAAVEELLARRDGSRLALLVTRRRSEGDDPALLVRLGETIARADGIRLDLTPLTLDETAVLVRAVNQSMGDVRSLWRRSGGNPFFVIELARTGGALGGGLADVIRARIAALPADTQTALSAASCLVQSVDPGLLADMLDCTETEARTVLRPAVDAGILSEGTDESGEADAPGAAPAADAGPEAPAGLEAPAGSATTSFAHDIVQEVLYDDLAVGEREGWHARAGRSLAEHGDLRRIEQRSALAHHWERAGATPASTGRRAVHLAARSARGDKAYGEEARLLRTVLKLQNADPRADDRERFDTLLELADACRWSGDWPGVAQSADEAMGIAERLRDDLLIARAAIATSEGALWLVRPFGVVHAPIVAALERLSARLEDDETDAGPGADPGLRVRVLLATAIESYYDPARTERNERLVAEAIRLAERSDDDDLRFTAYQLGSIAISRLDTAEHRRDLARSAVEVARRLQDPRALIFAEALLLQAASELGDAGHVRARVDQVIQLAEDQGMRTVEAACRVLALNWAALGGDLRAISAHREALTRLLQHTRIPNFDSAVLGTFACVSMLTGDREGLTAILAQFPAEPPPGSDAQMRLFRASMLLVLGETERARALLAGAAIEWHDHTYVAPLLAGMICSSSAALGAGPATHQTYRHLLRFRGRMCSAGFAMALGPVDLFLALGALALGEFDAAEAHLNDAERIIEELGLSAVSPRIDTIRAGIAMRRTGDPRTS